MIANGYQDPRTLERRIKAMEKWLANPELLEADKDAEYAAVIEINMDDIKEPIIACPNDPDDVCFMSERSGTKIDEVFIGSCMTNIGHFRAASKLLEGKADTPSACGLRRRPKWTRNNCPTKDTTAYSDVPARVWKCRVAPYVWVIRRKYAKVRPLCPPPPATSRTVWVKHLCLPRFGGIGSDLLQTG